MTKSCLTSFYQHFSQTWHSLMLDATLRSLTKNSIILSIPYLYSALAKTQWALGTTCYKYQKWIRRVDNLVQLDVDHLIFIEMVVYELNRDLVTVNI